MAQDAHNSVMVITLLIKMAMLIIAVLLFCEVGENVSNVFGEIEYEVGQIKWYLLSKSTKQLHVTIMTFCRKPIELDGFGSIKGSREVSKQVSSFQIKCMNSKKIFSNSMFFQVVETAYSYFMMLRSL